MKRCVIAPTHQKVGVPLEDWRQWRTEINNCLVKKMFTGNPGHGFVPFDEYLDYPSGQHTGHGNEDDTGHQNLLVYSNAQENHTDLKGRDFLRYGIPRAAVSSLQRRISVSEDEDDEDDDDGQVQYSDRPVTEAKILRDVETQTTIQSHKSRKQEAQQQNWRRKVKRENSQHAAYNVRSGRKTSPIRLVLSGKAASPSRGQFSQKHLPRVAMDRKHTLPSWPPPKGAPVKRELSPRRKLQPDPLRMSRPLHRQPSGRLNRSPQRPERSPQRHVPPSSSPVRRAHSPYRKSLNEQRQFRNSVFRKSGNAVVVC